MCRIEAGMHTVTTLIAIFVIVTAIALITSGSFTTSTLAVKKKSTVTTKKSTGSKKIKTHRHTGTGSSGTTGGTSSGSTLGGGGTGTSTLGGSSSGGSGTAGGTDPFSKFISCMRLSAGPLTRAGVDQCYNIVYGTSSTSSSVGSPPHMGPSGNVAPTLGTP
jgi:hypothetical protein